MSLVVNGQPRAVAGLTCISWLQNKVYRLTNEDCTARPPGLRIRAIVLHTTIGKVGPLVPGKGRSASAPANIANWWSGNGSAAGAHLIVDVDGYVYCLADLQKEVAYHAGPVNSRTIGVEVVQRGSDNAVFADQLDSLVTLVDWLTAEFRIQRQFHTPYKGVLSRLSQGAGADCVGIYGHRDITSMRGAGDPGDHVFAALKDAGYEGFDFGRREDIDVWKERQRSLPRYSGTVDGLPLNMTCDALALAGYAHGLWIERPNRGNDVA